MIGSVCLTAVMQAAVQAHPVLDGWTNAVLLIALIIDHLVRLTAIIVAIILTLAMIMSSRKSQVEDEPVQEQLTVQEKKPVLSRKTQEKQRSMGRSLITANTKAISASKKQTEVVQKEVPKPKTKVLYGVEVKESSLINQQNIFLERTSSSYPVLLLCSDHTLQIQDEYLQYNDVSRIFNKHHVQLVYEYVDQYGKAWARSVGFRIKQIRKAPEVIDNANGTLELRSKGILIVE